MKLLLTVSTILAALVATAAEGEVVWTSRSVLQRTTATCTENQGTTVRAYRNVDLDKGSFTLMTNLVQRATLLEDCDSMSTFVFSDMLLNGDVLINRRPFNVTSECETVENKGKDFAGEFNLDEAATIRLTFETTGGACSAVEADWTELQIVKN